jgi:hypothetical protein
MRVLSNPKYELFAQGLAKGLTGDKAYTDAGFKPGAGNASRLKQRPEIQARLAELLAAGAEWAEVSAEGVVQMLVDSDNKAVEAKQYGPAVRAAELLGRRHGMFVDKTALTTESRLSDADLLARLAGDEPSKVELLRGLLVPATFGRA